MKVFSLDEDKAVELSEEHLFLERQIQRVTETNLQQIFGLDLVKSEFELHGLRIDTLAYNNESNAFVIIGIAYLNLMLNNKADFILEYNETHTKPLSRHEVDWSQSRVIFIAPEFTKYQQHAIGFRDIGIQLYEIHKYTSGLILFNEIQSPFERRESISTISKGSSETKRITEEIKVYDENELLRIAEDKTKDLYHELKYAILKLGKDIEVRPTKMYIAFRHNIGFAGVVILKSKLKIYINIDISLLNDPMKKARDVKDIGHYSHGDTEIIIQEIDEIPYALELIKQAYQKN